MSIYRVNLCVSVLLCSLLSPCVLSSALLSSPSSSSSFPCSYFHAVTINDDDAGKRSI